jgi:hypothetical protein
MHQDYRLPAPAQLIGELDVLKVVTLHLRPPKND